MNFSVGQILYLLSAKSMKVIPALVVEEVTIKTLDGEKISYNVRLPGKRTKTNLDSIDALPFGTTDDLKTFMVTNAKKSIDKMIQASMAIAHSEFKKKKEKKPVDEKTVRTVSLEQINLESKDDHEEVENKDRVLVDMGDGTKASIQVKNLTGVMNENIVV